MGVIYEYQPMYNFTQRDHGSSFEFARPLSRPMASALAFEAVGLRALSWEPQAVSVTATQDTILMISLSCLSVFPSSLIPAW